MYRGNTPEEGLTNHRAFHQHRQAGFWSNNPFTLSISQNIQNTRTSRNVRNIDEVDLPSRPSQPYRSHARSHWPRSPAVQRTTPHYRQAYPGPVEEPYPPQRQPSMTPGPPIIVDLPLSQRNSSNSPIRLASRVRASRVVRAEYSQSRSPSRRRSSRSSYRRSRSRHDSPRRKSESLIYVAPRLHSVSGDDIPWSLPSSSERHHLEPLPSTPSVIASSEPPLTLTASLESHHLDNSENDDRPDILLSLSSHGSWTPSRLRFPHRENSSAPDRLTSSADIGHQLQSLHPLPTPQSEAKDAPESTRYFYPPHRVNTFQSNPPAYRTEYEAPKLRAYILTFITDTMPRQIYLHLLLRLPYLYFSRVERIFREAEMTIGEIKEMALQATAEDNKSFQDDMLHMEQWYYPAENSRLSPAYLRLKTGWEQFIDGLMREWKTFNLISVLLLSAIMTMFQIQGAAEDPVTRYIAFWSLICALMSLLNGCLFIIRFGTMRKASKAAEWALEAQNSQNIIWNVWVMLAMPVLWLSWSILTFIACIMSFMWRTQANMPPNFVFSITHLTETALRIFICAVLAIGGLYGALIINTLRRYGSQMDEAWQRRVHDFIDNSRSPPPIKIATPRIQSWRTRSHSHSAHRSEIPYPVSHVSSRYSPGTTQMDFPGRLRLPTPVTVPKPNTSERDGSQIPYLVATTRPQILMEDQALNSVGPNDAFMGSPPTPLEPRTSNRPQSPASHSVGRPSTPLPPPEMTQSQVQRGWSTTSWYRPLPPKSTSRPRTSISRKAPDIDSTDPTDVPPAFARVQNKERGRSPNRRWSRRSLSLDGGGHLPKIQNSGKVLPILPLSRDEHEELPHEVGRLNPVSAITKSTEDATQESHFYDVSPNGDEQKTPGA